MSIDSRDQSCKIAKPFVQILNFFLDRRLFGVQLQCLNLSTSLLGQL
ncbi:unnamed protein product [Ixodes pacificus]